MEILYDLQYNWLQNKIIYDYPEKLYDLATIQAAVNLRYKDKIGREETLKNVQKKLLSMILPVSVKNDVAQKVELIEEQLLKFVELLPPNFLKQSRWSVLKKKIYWTLQATIDKIKTAEALTDAIELNLET